MGLLSLAVLLAAAGYGAFYGYGIYMEGHVSLDDASFDVRADQDTPDVEYAKPVPDAQLGQTELRWCLRQRLRIDVLTSLARTNREFFALNRLNEEYGGLCDTSAAGENDLALAEAFIEERRDTLVQQAVDDQLFYLGEQSGDGAVGRSQLVMEIQRILDTIGYDVGDIDGIYGTKTRASILAFERDMGIAETGIASQGLLQALRERVRQGGT